MASFTMNDDDGFWRICQLNYIYGFQACLPNSPPANSHHGLVKEARTCPRLCSG